MLGWIPLLFLFSLGTAQEESDASTGIYVRINERGIKEIGDLASDALPLLLENVTLPKVTTSSATIIPSIKAFDRPSVHVDFIDGSGAHATFFLPHVVVLADSDIMILFYSVQENMTLTVSNATVHLELSFGRNSTTNGHEIRATNCTVIDPTISIEFKNNSGLAPFEDMIKDKVAGALRDAVCGTAVEALVYLDQQQIQKDPLAPLPLPEEDGLSAGELASDLCEHEEAEEGPRVGGLSSPIQTGPPWSVNLSLSLPPTFTHETVTFGLEGGVLLAGLPASRVPPPPPIDTSLLGDKMVGVMLTDYVPNTFFSQVFDYGIGQVDYRVHPSSLPSSLRSLAKMLCSKCYLHVTGYLIQKPRVEIDAVLGARVLLAANVSVDFNSRGTVYNMINASTNMLMTLRPLVRQSRVYGDVALTSVDFDITQLAVGGALAGPMERLMGFIVPRTLWPTIQKRIRFALHQRGVQLPTRCGVELKHLSVSYTKRAVVLHSDFAFQLDHFVSKFKLYVNRKVLGTGGSPVYV